MRALRFALATGLAVCAGAPAPGAEIREVARESLANHRDAIITVKLLLTQRFIAEGRERNTSESQLEIAGTVLTPEGLTAVSDLASNPAAMAASAPGSNTRLDSETGSVELVLADGREVAARFVLRDSDLDLAFLMPEEPLQGLPYVALVEAPAPRLLDELVFLFPLARTLGREIGVSLEAVRAVIDKPRTFVVADSFVGLQSLGCPVFDAAGRPIGLVVMRRSPVRPRPTGGFRDMFEYLNPVLLTAADVLDVAGQALAQAKGDAR